MLSLTAISLVVLLGAPVSAPVTVKPPSRVAAYPGVRLEVPLAIEVALGFHVQANPASRPELIPLTVRITDDAGLKIDRPLYPPGAPHKLETSRDDISVYEGSFQVGIPIEVSDGLDPGERVVSGHVRFQSCDDKRCHLPATAPFSISIRVGAPAVPERDRAQMPPRKQRAPKARNIR